MSDVVWLEVQGAVEAMIKNLGKLAEHNPETSVRGDDFDALLVRARTAFPDSAAIRDLRKIESVTTLVDLLGKLSILEGAVKAAFVGRDTIEIVEHNEQMRRQLEEFTR